MLYPLGLVMRVYVGIINEESIHSFGNQIVATGAAAILPASVGYIDPVFVGPVLVAVQTKILVVLIVTPKGLKGANVQIAVDQVTSGLMQ